MRDKDFRHSFVVVSNLNRNIILGNDWMESNWVILYFNLMKLRVDDTYVPLEGDIHISSLVCSKRDFVLPPQTACVCQVKMKKSEYFEKEKYLEISKPSKGFVVEEPGIKVYECGVTVNKRGEYPLLVANETNKTYKIRRGCVLGEVSPVNKVESVNFGKMSHSGEKASWTEADVRAPDQWKKKVVQMVKDNQDLFAHSDMDLSKTETVTMKIDTGDAEPIRLKPYKTPLNKRKVIDKSGR